ncbi:unnamed protein product [Trifolium pratense]|uniref:Uncharacterized protein n=1 Tax=Trifolium pratense TaxID=57577 RepID=A0ACB0M2X5_TRIPR|nr:unnamed protein product [Trifolium pratense]
MSSKSSNNTVLLRFFIIKSSKPKAPRFKSVPTKLLVFKGVDFKIKRLTVAGKRLKLTIWDTILAYQVTKYVKIEGIIEQVISVPVTH